MTTAFQFNPFTGNFDLVTTSLPGSVITGFTQGSVIFAGAGGLSEDNSKLFWDDTNFRLGIGTAIPSQALDIVGQINSNNILPNDTPGFGLEFNVQSNTTVDGSITTIGIQGVASGTVQVGATNDKAIMGSVVTTTRGDTTDEGTMSGIGGYSSLVFNNPGPAGITSAGFGFLSLLFTPGGTLDTWYDFYGQHNGGGGVLTTHYGVYINADSTSPVKNWLGDFTTIGGTSFSAPTVELDVNGAARVRNLSTGIVHADSSGNLSSSPADLTTEVTGVLPEANGGTNQSTYTTGDTLYASASNTLSKLAIGSTNDVLTVSGGVPVWAPASGAVPADSTIYLDTASGHGLTGTAIRTFNASTTTGTDLTYTADAINGDFITVNTTGRYSLMWVDRNSGGASDFGFSMNQSNLTQGPSALSPSELIFWTRIAGTGGSVNADAYFTTGDVIRFNDGGAANNSISSSKQAIITRIG